MSKPELHQLGAYDFDLPETLIAQKPAQPRDSARLLVLHRNSGKIEHRTFADLPSYMDANDLFVANNTQVFKARLLGHRLIQEGETWIEGGKVEFLLLEEVAPLTWEGMFHASVKHKPGVRFLIKTPDGKGLYGELIQGASDSEHGTVVASFDRDPISCGAGIVPLPPYIRRKHLTPMGSPTGSDDEDYQTVYAKRLGSAAAPTAGLHFSERVMKSLRERGVEWEEITLHVGLGTFRPVKDEDVRRHVMHEERFEIASDVAGRITEGKRNGKRIVAVGTTSVRTLESAWDQEGFLRFGPGRTSLFIRPGEYQFRVVDRMLTNFHLPRSTLLMLVCAFAGREAVLEAYREAVKEGYRFFSYGDAMLLI